MCVCVCVCVCVYWPRVGHSVASATFLQSDTVISICSPEATKGRNQMPFCVEMRHVTFGVSYRHLRHNINAYVFSIWQNAWNRAYHKHCILATKSWENYNSPTSYRKDGICYVVPIHRTRSKRGLVLSVGIVAFRERTRPHCGNCRVLRDDSSSLWKLSCPKR